MPKTIKVALITQQDGGHQPDYLGALAKIEEVEAVALVDASGKSEELAKMLLGDKLKEVYKDSAEMLKKFAPQAVLVSLEAVASPPVINQVLDAGCHAIVEKPSCVKAEDFEKLVRKAQQKHRHLIMTLANRPHAPIREARRLVQAGKFGKIYGTEMHLVTDQTRLTKEQYRKTWFCSKARAGGGHVTWVAVHWIDMLLHVTGLKIKQVTGFAANVGGQPIDIEDAASMSVRFDNGGVGSMNFGYYLDKGYQSHFKIWGEHGWLQLASVEERPLEWYSRKDVKEPKIELFQYPKGERGYLRFMRSAVRACAELEEPPITGEEALHVLKSIFAFYEAVKTGRTQTVE